jgi:hypothetical protein
MAEFGMVPARTASKQDSAMEANRLGRNSVVGSIASLHAGFGGGFRGDSQ